MTDASLKRSGGAFAEIERMRQSVFFDGPQQKQSLSRFWMLLVLSSVIAAAGVVADSTATVIGAMIVAPMMVPIQGTMLATVLGDRANLSRSVTLVVTGALTAIGIGYLLGLAISGDVVSATNSQVAGRVSPGLIDLLAALATGVVGSIALVRRDIADTLPGVAIAISLVPPLSVIGLTLESQAYGESIGALVLFLTNVAAILATGVVVMTVYRVNRGLPTTTGVVSTMTGSLSTATGAVRPVNRKRAIAMIIVMLVVVTIGLTLSSIKIGLTAARENTVKSAADAWAQAHGWEILGIRSTNSDMLIRAAGPLPSPDTQELVDMLEQRDIDVSGITVELILAHTERLGETAPADE